jgi:hypothetical protein
VLPGFFWKAAAGGKPAQTLIMIGGGETFAEDLFCTFSPRFHGAIGTKMGAGVGLAAKKAVPG